MQAASIRCSASFQFFFLRWKMIILMKPAVTNVSQLPKKHFICEKKRSFGLPVDEEKDAAITLLNWVSFENQWKDW